MRLMGSVCVCVCMCVCVHVLACVDMCAFVCVSHLCKYNWNLEQSILHLIRELLNIVSSEVISRDDGA